MRNFVKDEALVLIAAILFYTLYFIISEGYQYLNYFDSVMTIDIAQIARNTFDGNYFQTNYILPSSFHFFPYLEHHPDFIRYPFPILLYGVLFELFGYTPLAIKIFTSFLFIWNVYFTTKILKRINKQINNKQSRLMNAGIGFTSLLLSFALLPYLKLALSDAYEIIATSLLIVLANFLIEDRKRIVLIGLLCGLIYLTRPNMSLLIPIIFIYLLIGKENLKIRIVNGFIFVLSVLIVLSPFIYRNLLLTGSPLFSLQQKIELAKFIMGSHEELYRSFDPKLITDLDITTIKLLVVKHFKMSFWTVVFMLKIYYIPGWLGLYILYRKFNQLRSIILLLLSFLFLHVIVFSLFIQLHRIYIPIIYILMLFGYYGLLVYLNDKMYDHLKFSNYVRQILNKKKYLLIGFVTLLYYPWLTPERDVRTMPPLEYSIDKLENEDIDYAFSNNPFWISWYTEITVIYETYNPDELIDNPIGCNMFYIADKRFSFPEEFIKHNSQKIFETRDIILYKLKPDS